MFDTHCHLDLAPLSESVDAVLERARAAGVCYCLTIGTTLPASRANVELASRYTMLRAAVGVHPNEAETVTESMWPELEALASAPEVVAIGEIGLDYYRQHAAPDRQRMVLQRCLNLAQRQHLPVLIHCREAYVPLLDLLRQVGSGPWRGVMHCASGPPEFVQEALALGFHISFAGNVTFPKADVVRALVPLVPDERLLIETDAPFLAPQPVRGQSNEPAYVAHTAAYLAQLRGTTAEVLGALTTRNACRLFRVPNSMIA